MDEYISSPNPVINASDSDRTRAYAGSAVVDGEVTTSFVEVWLEGSEIETVYRAYKLMEVLTPPNTQVYIAPPKGIVQGMCKVALSYPLDQKKPRSYANSFTVSEVVKIEGLEPAELMEHLIDLAKRKQRAIKWQITQARRRQWLFSGENMRIDGTDKQQFSSKSVEAL